MKTTFLYFAYGSNLLTERIRLNNPTAVKRAVAKLQNYHLEFTAFAPRWHGAVATIILTPRKCVWGVVWEVENSDLESLDRQESGYNPITIEVSGLDGTGYRCRTYQMMKVSDDEEERPSVVYKNVIINGAVENGLPKEYVDQLCKIKDNGYNGPVEVKLSTTRSFRG